MTIREAIRRPTPLLAALAAIGTLALAACDTGTLESPVDAPEVQADHSIHALASQRPAGPDAGGAPDLARMRAGSAPFRNVDRAVAAGFVDVSGCVSAPPGAPFTGAMGHHYVNLERLADIGVDPSRPEMLLYIPNAQGRMELVGVEFAVNAEAWHELHGNDVFPEVAGVRFDPPVPGHPNPIVSTSYTLHVWNWRENPDGMFTPFNPTLSCPGA